MDDFNKTSNHNDTSYCASVTEGEFFPNFFVHCSVTKKNCKPCEEKEKHRNIIRIMTISIAIQHSII